MEEKKETCNISYSRELVQNALSDLANATEKEKEDHKKNLLLFTNFKDLCISFFKKFGDTCECSECLSLVSHILRIILRRIAESIIDPWEILLDEVHFIVGKKKIVMKIKENDGPATS